MATTPRPTAPRIRKAPVKTAATPAVLEEVVAPATTPATTEITPVTEVLIIAEQGKIKKAKKPKLVRDSFTIPADEYAIIDTLKARCLTAGVAVKKSELLRAGLLTLQALTDKKLAETLDKLEKLKTGRPTK